MPEQSRPQEFLRKSKEAEESAANAKTVKERDSWLRIAENDRLLAKPA